MSDAVRVAIQSLRAAGVAYVAATVNLDVTRHVTVLVEHEAKHAWGVFRNVCLRNFDWDIGDIMITRQRNTLFVVPKESGNV